MKLVIISDSHNLHDELDLPVGDVLIHCGDYSYSGQDNEVISFLTWMQEQTKKYRLVIGGHGNHELGPYEDREHFNELKTVFAPDVIWPHMRVFTDPVTSLNFFFSPYVTTINGRWAFEASSSEYQEIVKRIPDYVDILISHGPPFNILDTFVRHSIDWDSQQNDYAHTSREFKIGSKVLAERIKEIEPKLVCFGHCHENGGQTVEIDGTIYVNGAVLNENYEIDNEPVIVNLEL